MASATTLHSRIQAGNDFLRALEVVLSRCSGTWVLAFEVDCQSYPKKLDERCLAATLLIIEGREGVLYLLTHLSHSLTS